MVNDRVNDMVNVIVNHTTQSDGLLTLSGSSTAVYADSEIRERLDTPGLGSCYSFDWSSIMLHRYFCCIIIC